MADVLQPARRTRSPKAAKSAADELSIQKGAGAVRVVNRLEEALSVAPFSAAQCKIVRVIIRQTYGWNRRTVRISLQELADRAGMVLSGGFRRALGDLIKANVIWQLDDASGRRAALYALNKAYYTWTGPLAVDSDQLRSLARATFESNDELFWARYNSMSHTGHDTNNAEEPYHVPAGTQDEGSVECPTEDIIVACPLRAGAPGGHRSMPFEGTRTPPKSFIGETYERPIDIIDSSSVLEKDLFTHNSNSVVPPSANGIAAAAVTATATITANAITANAITEPATYAAKLAAALNAGIEKRWGAQPLVVPYSTGLTMVESLMRRSIPVEDAQRAILAWCETTRKPEPPRALSYVAEPVEKWLRDQEQRAIDAREREQLAGLRSGQSAEPESLGAMLSRVAGSVGNDGSGATSSRADLENEHAEHAQARRAAALAWGNDPANALQRSAIVASVAHDLAGAGRFWERARAEEVILRSAAAAGFPAFEAWLERRAPSVRDPGPEAGAGFSTRTRV